MLDGVKITLLTKEEYLGSDKKGLFKHDYQLEAIKKYGMQIFNTTLVKLTEGNEGYSWTKTKGMGNKVGVIDFTGKYYEVDSNYLPVGIRPVLKLPGRVDKIFPFSEAKPYYDGQCEFVELGEYPQGIPDIDILLETSYKENKLRKTGREFHINNQICEEYQYIDGKKYIRYKVDLRIYKSVYIHRRLEIENGEYVWLNVRPVKWLVDKTDTLISEYNLISGIIFSMDGYDGNFEKTYMYDFLNNVMFRDIFQDYLPKKEEIKDKSKKEEVKNEEVKDNDIEIKDTILKWIKELLQKNEEIKDENDKINIAKDLMALAKVYTDELIKIKGKEPNKYGDKRNLIAGIMPYYVYIDGEIKREISEDNKDKETKEITDTINNLMEKTKLIENEDIRLDILSEIEELKLSYLKELNFGKKNYERIDFSKPLEKHKDNNGNEYMKYIEKLTLKSPRPILIKELMEKELAISKRIDKELASNNIRNELSEIEKYADEIMKR